MDEGTNKANAAPDDSAGFLKSHIFMLTIPQVDGGSNLSVKIRWSQKLVYSDGQFTLSVPFSFPDYVTPASKKASKKEKIQVNVNAGTETEVLCNTTSHPLKQYRREVGKLNFLYEAEVLSWSKADLNFSYTVSSGHISGGILLQSPSVNDIDQREMFSLYLFPGNKQNNKVFRRELVFVVDISGSMKGKPIEDTKSVLSAVLSKLDPEDSFNIIAFNGETYIYSTKLELATQEAVHRATEWIGINLIAGGGTDFLPPLNKAIEMFSRKHGSLPMIFFMTDGTVEDERHICNTLKGHLADKGPITPRIYTFGIGSFCNHYFLQMLALISRGYYDAAHDIDSIELQMLKLCTRASSAILTNLTIDGLENLDEVEVSPYNVPDLSTESPLIISGRYRGNFPESIRVKGILADMSNHVIDLKVQRAKDIPLDRLSAKPRIDLLTAQAWLLENKQLEGKVTKLSIQTGFLSEYTLMILLETDRGRKAAESCEKLSKKSSSGKGTDSKGQKTVLLRSLGIGFGNLNATLENIPPGADEEKLPQAAEVFVKAATNCCGRMCGFCCCMCCVQCCERINNQCATALTQLCAALACFGCFECCAELCCSGNDS